MSFLPILSDQWKSLLAMLPRGFDLEKTVRESKALVRRRGIASAEALLRLILMYSLCGLSLRATAAWAQAQGVADVSDVALLKRLRKANSWMGQLLAAKLAERVEGLEPQLPLSYRLRIVDATTASIPGSQGTDYRVHLGFDLGSFQVDRIEVTGAQGGESYSRLGIEAGDLILGDRGHCHRRGLAAVHQAGADFLVRINWQNLPLEDAQHQRLDLVELLESVEGSEAVEFDLATVADPSQAIPSLPVRLIVVRKPPEAAEAERRRILREASRKGRTANPKTLKAAAFFFVLTSVPQSALSAEKVLELYRLRWQIEMAFKRMKGLLHLGELPMKDPQLAHGYLCAKLLAALMLEDLTKDFLAFSPSGSAGPVQAGVSVANPADPSGGSVLCAAGESELRGSDVQGF
jgi:Transposase DDE domain